MRLFKWGKKSYFMVLFIGATLIYGGIKSEGQTKINLENNWNLNEIQVTISKSILGGEPGFEVKRTAEKRIFIEVTGWVTAKNLEKASIKISQITLSGSSIKPDFSTCDLPDAGPPTNSIDLGFSTGVLFLK